MNKNPTGNIQKAHQLGAQSPSMCDDLLSRIRRRCLDCAGDPLRIELCPAGGECPLWEYRFGKSPSALIELLPHSSHMLMDPARVRERNPFDVYVEGRLLECLPDSSELGLDREIGE